MRTQGQRRVLVGLLVAAGLLAHGCRSQESDPQNSAAGDMRGNTGLNNNNRDFSVSESNKGSVNPDSPGSGVAGETPRQGAPESGSGPTAAQPPQAMEEGTGGSGFGPTTLSRTDEEQLGTGTPPVGPDPNVPGLQPTPEQEKAQIEQLQKWLKDRQQQAGQQR